MRAAKEGRYQGVNINKVIKVRLHDQEEIGTGCEIKVSWKGESDGA
jgi:hypothetical protein